MFLISALFCLYSLQIVTSNKKTFLLEGWKEKKCVGINDATIPVLHELELQAMVNLTNQPKFKDTIVLEWGTGGSTNILAWSAKAVYSVEHATPFCELMLGMSATKCNIERGVLTYACSNVPSKYLRGFGRLTGVTPNQVVQFGQQYFKTAEELVTEKHEKPNICLVDGRYRVAMALQCAKWLKGQNFSETSGFVMIHDYERKEYHVVEKYMIKVKQVQRLVFLRLRDDINWDLLEKDINYHYTQSE
jgi:hypothetical protein